MKKIYYLIAMAMMAFTFTSCEDVPEPFGQPINPNKAEETIDPAGDGTAASPYNVAAAIAKCKEVGEAGSTEKYYIKGIVVEGGEIPAGDTYGNITFKIADTPDSKNMFMAYQVFGSEGVHLPNGYKVDVGAEVVLYGPIVNYKSNTPETQGKGAAYIVTINGKPTGGSDEPTPSGNHGTAEAPLTVAQAIALIDAESTISEAYVKGKISQIDSYSAQYKSITYWISDDGTTKTQLQVYSGKGLNGADFTSKDDIKVGQTVTIKGALKKYNTTYEFDKTSSIISIDGEGGGDTPTPSGEGDGTEAKPFNVTSAIAAGSGTDVFVKAYIVGWIEGQVLASGAHFDGNASVATNILIADTPDQTDVAKCMPVQLPSGAIRSAVNLKDNASNYKKEIILVGNIEKYFGAPGIKGTSYAKIGSTETGTKPGGSGNGGDNPSPSGDVKTVTIADFNAAAESNDVWYQLTGTVKNLKDNDQYGNFDIEDATGSVYVYGLLSEKGGEKKKFKELVAAKGIANGKKITIIGNRGSFNGKIEVLNAYFVSVE